MRIEGLCEAASTFAVHLTLLGGRYVEKEQDGLAQHHSSLTVRSEDWCKLRYANSGRLLLTAVMTVRCRLLRCVTLSYTTHDQHTHCVPVVKLLAHEVRAETPWCLHIVGLDALDVVRLSTAQRAHKAGQLPSEGAGHCYSGGQLCCKCQH